MAYHAVDHFQFVRLSARRTSSTRVVRYVPLFRYVPLWSRMATVECIFRADNKFQWNQMAYYY